MKVFCPIVAESLDKYRKKSGHLVVCMKDVFFLLFIELIPRSLMQIQSSSMKYGE